MAGKGCQVSHKMEMVEARGGEKGEALVKTEVLEGKGIGWRD